MDLIGTGGKDEGGGGGGGGEFRSISDRFKILRK